MFDCTIFLWGTEGILCWFSLPGCGDVFCCDAYDSQPGWRMRTVFKSAGEVPTDP